MTKHSLLYIESMVGNIEYMKVKKPHHVILYIPIMVVVI
jgi:hypothetical protein